MGCLACQEFGEPLTSVVLREPLTPLTLEAMMTGLARLSHATKSEEKDADEEEGRSSRIRQGVEGKGVEGIIVGRVCGLVPSDTEVRNELVGRM